jgi:hypothetical protein
MNRFPWGSWPPEGSFADQRSASQMWILYGLPSSVGELAAGGFFRRSEIGELVVDLYGLPSSD